MLPFELHRFAKQHYSGVEDRGQRVHQAETELVRRYFGDRGPGVFVEVGANHPYSSSQTWHLEQAGWRGLLVEPIPALCDRLRQARPNSSVVQAACSAPDATGETEFYVKQGFAQSTLAPERLNLASDVMEVIRVEVRTLDQILATAQLPRIDFVSIDVEGLQLEVLEGFTLSAHQPRLLLVEDHLADLRTHRYVASQGYQLVKRTARNNWYIPAGAPFSLTSPGERLWLWKQLWLSTPVRKLRALQRRVTTRRAA